ncbi:MAG: cytochrome c [Verrucomicrobiota bacterium]
MSRFFRNLPWMVVLIATSTGAKTTTPEAATSEVTFNEHIAPIVHQNCTVCHREGQAGPFKLESYRDVAKRSQLILDVIEDRYMPPWKPVPGHGEFANQRTLTDEQIEMFGEWVDAGRPEGDADKAPVPPKFSDGWMLGEPDLIVEMDEAYVVPADGPDVYRNFAVPLNLDEDKWVKAIEYRPSARSVVHHVLFFLDDTGEAVKADGQDGKPGFNRMNFSRGGGLGGFIPGAEPLYWPGDLAQPIKKGSDLVLASHFHPSGKVEREKATIGLYFADKPSSKKILSVQVPPVFGRTTGLDIPAGEKEYRISDAFTLPAAVEGIVISGHAHYVCKTMKMTATFPDQSERSLLYIDDWDLNWQGSYLYKSPVVLPEGTVLRSEIVYDNSADNPRNPFDPPQRIMWGRESTDEMGSITLQFVAVDSKDVPKIERAVRSHRGRKVVAQLGKELLNGDFKERLGMERERAIQGIVTRLDRNKDQKLQKLEVPAQYRANWDKGDVNNDGGLNVEELEAIWPDIRRQILMDQIRQRRQKPRTTERPS